MIITRNIREYALLCEGDRIRARELALDPQSVEILNSYTAFCQTGNRNVKDFLDQEGLP
jgi:hypothetical protein